MDKKVDFLNKELYKFKDEIVVDVFTALGVYTGTFCFPRKAISVLHKLNSEVEGYLFQIRNG